MVERGLDLPMPVMTSGTWITSVLALSRLNLVPVGVKQPPSLVLWEWQGQLSAQSLGQRTGGKPGGPSPLGSISKSLG